MNKPRCNGTMTEAQYLAWIRSSLRKQWLRWLPRAKAIELARRPYKGLNKLQKWEVKCSICLEWFKLKEIEVDHYPHEAGSIKSAEDIGPFAERLYCETSNLRCICKPCHKIHTLATARGITFEEAIVEKEVIAFDKLKVDKQQEILYNVGLVPAKTKAGRKEQYGEYLRRKR